MKFEDALLETFGEEYKSLSLDGQSALSDDLWELMAETKLHSWDAAKILSRRIGGPSALSSYVECLLAGIARKVGGGK